MARWRTVTLIFALFAVPAAAWAGVELSSDSCGCAAGNPCKCASSCPCSK